MAYNLPIVAPRKTGLERFTGGLGQGVQMANALQQMAARRRQEELAQQAIPGQQQQDQAKLQSMNALTALRQKQTTMLGGEKGKVKHGIDAFGRPFAVSVDAPGAASMPGQVDEPGDAPYGINPANPEMTTLSKEPTSTDVTQPGAQSPFIPSPIDKASTWYNPHTGEYLSTLTPQGRTQAQKQLAAYKTILRIIPQLKKHGTKGFGGPPLAPKDSFIGGTIDFLNDPSAAPNYGMHLETGKDELNVARNMGKSDAALHSAERIVGRHPNETSEAYDKRMDDFKADEVIPMINGLTGALKAGGVPLGGPIEQSTQEPVAQQQAETQLPPLPPGMVAVNKPSGETVMIPQANLQRALAAGWTSAQ